MGASKAVAWLECAVAFVVPVAAVLATPFLDACRRPTTWSAAIYALLVVLALYLVTSPFIVEFFRRRSSNSATASLDRLAPVLLLAGLAGSSAVSFMGLFTVCFANGSGVHVYGWVAVSVVGMLYYVWRYRRVLV
jgi:hypothetical protein